MKPNESGRVLIVNDHEWSARSLESLLSPAGIEVVRVFTAHQARESVASGPPDVIVLDTQLPDVDGPKFCEELRQSGAVDGTVPILITTAAPAGRLERARALQAGALDFFPLPVDSEHFLLKVQNLLAGRRAGREAVLMDRETGCCTEVGLFARGGALATAASAQGLRVSCVRVGLQMSRKGVGPLVKRIGRRSDVFAVINDGELAVLGTVEDDRGAEAMASRLASLFSEGREGLTGGPNPIPIGYATSEADPRAIRHLFNRAERALAQAKTSGKSRPLGDHELIAS